MRISVFGLGYVGAVSMACLARDGHQVVGVDVELVWGNLTHSTMQGEVSKHTQMSGDVPNLLAHHEGYITWDELLTNQDRPAKNRTNATGRQLNSPLRMRTRMAGVRG